jgi:sulfur-oxidizing protein SoxY
LIIFGLYNVPVTKREIAMSDTRRKFIKSSLSFSACAMFATTGLLTPRTSNAAWPRENVAESSFAETLKRLYGEHELQETKKIKFRLPRIAENGAVVPITVTSSLDNVENITLLVEKNPVPLAASFNLAPECIASVSARLKMAETSDVIAVVKAGPEYYTAKQTVKVTIGGCGG